MIAPNVNQASIALEWDCRLRLDRVRPDISVRLDPFIQTKTSVQRAITVPWALARPSAAPLAPMDQTLLWKTLIRANHVHLESTANMPANQFLVVFAPLVTIVPEDRALLPQQTMFVRP